VVQKAWQDGLGGKPPVAVRKIFINSTTQLNIPFTISYNLQMIDATESLTQFFVTINELEDIPSLSIRLQRAYTTGEVAHPKETGECVLCLKMWIQCLDSPCVSQVSSLT